MDRSAKSLAVAGVALAAIVACGGSGSTSPGSSGSSGSSGGAGSSGTLDCAFVNGDNCWKTALASALSCLPPGAAKGTLSADGMTCTYASGTVVTFASPLDIGPAAGVGQFTLTTAGQACIGYDVTPGRAVTITTPGGAVVLASSADHQTISLTCPDGSVYTGPAQSLSACSDQLPGFDQGEGLGFTAAAADGGSLDGGYSGDFSTTAAALDGGRSDITIFDCATP